MHQAVLGGVDRPGVMVVQGEDEAIRVGVEEEFHVVDVRTRRLASGAELLLEALPGSSFARELQRSTVESNSRPFRRLEDLARDLCGLRRRLIRQADEVGLGISAAGSAPLVEMGEVKVSPEPRYEQMLNDYQQLTREQLICGTHVHAEVRDPDLAVVVAHRLTPWLPPLLALSSSSPYWDGGDTGYASYRSLVWQRWPTAGPIAKYDSAAAYEAMIKELIRSGVIADPGMIYSDIRPSQHVPTVELRICDSCPRVRDVVLIAGLFRALVTRELEAVRQGVERDVHLEAVRAATWQAARSGLEGELIDPVGGVPRPAPVVIRRLVEGLRPQLEGSADARLVPELAEEALARGSSARRQRDAFARRGRLADVVDLLLAETRDCQWDRPADGPPPYRSAAS
ncbi:glutamate--cysteine ligase [Nonomuraea rubra]|uniref:Putative glutamate--cysteine ligase 2 n=1 Tax=Nonomuraea rubra TaxID=46180 RepID=A0A7X0NUU3_9ACTN|nr:glutamate--cysteine ligase [Nonomuraea rubra]MBB6550053.1 carboxylate-amine ligase [Nonomuraea rubra]